MNVFENKKFKFSYQKENYVCGCVMFGGLLKIFQGGREIAVKKICIVGCTQYY